MHINVAFRLWRSNFIDELIVIVPIDIALTTFGIVNGVQEHWNAPKYAPSPTVNAEANVTLSSSVICAVVVVQC